MKPFPDIILASGSPRRSELLQQAGVRFEVQPADIEETRLEGESPADFVRRMACEKALEGLSHSDGTKPVLGADTVVLLDNEIFGKPVSRSDARKMLTRLSGHTHEVLSAVALAGPDGNVNCVLACTRVTFGNIPAVWIASYCEQDEPMDKAGAYAIQGKAAVWISQLEGSHSCVMGLPLYETCTLLRAM
jgi:septum formation protein